jgi:Trypsin-like peptidase domain
VKVADFFHKVYLVDEANAPRRFLGSAFSVAPGGSLLTCRHVVDVSIPSGQSLAVWDSALSQFVLVDDPPRFSADTRVDMAYLPAVFGSRRHEFFPVITPSVPLTGQKVYTFGYFAIGGGVADVEQGYFSGHVVNFRPDVTEGAIASMTLPFPILEGMSGSPILTYHNGPKLLGVATGNRTSRILASEVMEYQDPSRQFKETVNRIVEFGVAYQPFAVATFLSEVGAEGYVVSDERLELPGFD